MLLRGLDFVRGWEGGGGLGRRGLYRLFGGRGSCDHAEPNSLLLCVCVRRVRREEEEEEEEEEGSVRV